MDPAPCLRQHTDASPGASRLYPCAVLGAWPIKRPSESSDSHSTSQGTTPYSGYGLDVDLGRVHDGSFEAMSSTHRIDPEAFQEGRMLRVL